jgi:hypothetical protein
MTTCLGSPTDSPLGSAQARPVAWAVQSVLSWGSDRSYCEDPAHYRRACCPEGAARPAPQRPDRS